MSCFFSIIDLNIDSFWKMSLCRNLFQALERYDNKEPWGKLLLWNIAGVYSGLLYWTVTEQKKKEAYWRRFPGKKIPHRKPSFFIGK
ncbi:hypothetical protein Gasu2_11610 [Galdieria sulphuraria]|uniref:Uncharacterized protein n=1 Tax=Galdieria sulphuraria TaxID=130081 RepID=M2Y1T8_GALSU|nr:uncharacterized protein Gasu_27810 [Galdieria sulphuraria]EME29779.1 hypothetical protein Gasu_27810 [Galdieria sulphuraria]GJD06767.1 hypothetical protein Gasu2_11610 [Galdieria sulphuraria]|eukprot:XP_005706299.1 hypothetical protein Gasu_27810 [Galdieria sulphuraria]